MQTPCDLALHMTRRQLLGRTGLTLGAVALASLLAEDGAAQVHPATLADEGPLRERPPHFAPRARHVIYLHMIGAPSQLDLFDHKPALAQWDGRPCPEDFILGRRFAFLRGH